MGAGPGLHGLPVRIPDLDQPWRRRAAARFSAEHAITSKEAWIVALLAVAEVSGRALVQAQRRRYRRPWPKRSVLNCEWASATMRVPRHVAGQAKGY